MHSTLPISLLLIGASLPIVAQTHYCIAGDLDHLTQTEVSACRAKMTQVRNTIRRRGAPSGWHFVVVCDETGWTDYVSFAGKSNAQMLKADFDTDRQEHWTFLRGSRMAEDNGEAAGVVLRAALQGVPGAHAQPGMDSLPQPIPNPERKLQVPELQIAETRLPDESIAGQ